MSKADVSFLATAKDEPDKIKYCLEYKEVDLPNDVETYFASLADRNPELTMELSKKKSGFLFFRKNIFGFSFSGKQVQTDAVVKEFQSKVG